VTTVADVKHAAIRVVNAEELLETIRALRRGESRLTPQIARKVMDQFSI
jgi:DNA-binding NarL/FixJ family response regulator